MVDDVPSRPRRPPQRPCPSALHRSVRRSHLATAADRARAARFLLGRGFAEARGARRARGGDAKPPCMTGAEIRRSFSSSSGSRGHEIVPSASLVPENDPTLLFTNAGMVQFKNVFLGTRDAAPTRAPPTRRSACASAASTTTSRRSGATPTTTRFFEMLGNWSFGDYYKRRRSPGRGSC